MIFTDKGKLVILGSDKRGTIYGIYELSRQIGVSPWYWMADAPIQKHDQLFAKSGIYTDGEPKVKYRGIFINDEWPSFGTWCKNQFGGINSKAYARIFELMLRLKANYFWPAMWDSRFNEDDPLSPQLADDMGIVMGTSHHEPMMRAHKEYVYRKDSIGAWDYATNKANLDRFFEEGLERNKAYDNLITIGMRGDGDVAMGNGDDEDNMKTLKDVVDGQLLNVCIRNLPVRFRNYGPSSPRYNVITMQASPCQMMLPYFSATTTGDTSVAQDQRRNRHARVAWVCTVDKYYDCRKDSRATESGIPDGH